VLVHNIVQQATQTDIINITITTNKQEIVLPEVCTKSFCWPSLLAHQTLLKQGYRKWGVTDGAAIGWAGRAAASPGIASRAVA
jgi:hypothetical protein